MRPSEPTPPRTCALCPVAGCGRELPVTPDSAHLSTHCLCPKRTRLQLGLSTTGRWVLRLQAYDQEERAEHNAIMHALISGQVTSKSHRRQRFDNAADATTADLVDAANARTGAANEMERYLLSGNLDRAVEAAERYAACRVAVTLLTRNYKSQRRREADRSGLWHHSAEFYIEQPGERLANVRLTFAFEAMYVNDSITVTSEENGQRVTGEVDAHGTTLRVVNARTIEVDSGVMVGDEGWRQLIRLLQRTEEGKPGKPADPRALIWRHNARKELELRPYVKTYYPQAVVALEALRRTLRVAPMLKEGPQEAQQGEFWPEWVLDGQPEDAPWSGNEREGDQTQAAGAGRSIDQYNQQGLRLQHSIKPRSGKPRARR
ncbi:hypothetical protein GCM10022631_11150 [Deinococcus rubellus]|uniref:hypothetical protein n=1 Tax=Deinococcus rubellus TaxID=1889240 RepID=UPI0031EF4F77